MQFFCERCGGLFNLPPKSRGAKRRYCDECRPEVKAEINTFGKSFRRVVKKRLDAAAQEGSKTVATAGACSDLEQRYRRRKARRK